MYTVKQIADLLEVSKPTVQKVINDNSIEADKIEKNKYRYYSYEKCVFVISVLNPNFDFSMLPKKTEKTPQNIEKLQSGTAKSLENTEKSQSIESLNKMLAIIEKQLEEKDKIIAQRDKELEQKSQELQKVRDDAAAERKDLQDKLAKAYEDITDLAKKAQYITAADKTNQIMEKIEQEVPESVIEINEEEPKEEIVEEKKGFFSKLFRRR